MNKKSPPELYSIDAENAVIGGLLIKSDCFDDIAMLLKADDFYLIQHRYIFNAISSLTQQNTPVDMLTVSESLKGKGVLEEVGGFAYLADMVSNTPSVANIMAYAEVIQQYSKQRQFLALGQFILNEMNEPKNAEKLDALSEQIEQRYTQISLNQTDKSAIRLADIFKSMFNKMEQSTLNADPVTGTPLGIQQIDELTTGGQSGELIIIAARPAMGKTALSLTATANILDKFTDQPIFYFSQEMPADQLLQRLMAMKSKVSLQKIRRSTELEDEDWNRLIDSVQYIQQHWTNRLIIDDEGALTIPRLRSKVRRYSRQYGLPSAIFIDYLQLMRGSGKVENRHLEITQISGALKALAKELGLPIYALSQLNRSLEQRLNKRPVNADLRESGSLEQDADVILFIYRDEVYHPESEDKGLAEIIIGKQRNGPLGNVKCRFFGEFSLFENEMNLNGYCYEH
ncbi:DNA helicase [Gallibacterium anatis]|uniref:replicative DNA helicase n=1 Tax=Gallibacterium anatis TaxID=750 RepID=UPI000531647F|nr:replicative DNA helicase [Gallibacterium anatis]KGQ26525.1 DNA helicase [Gallibacterium anatis]KGQ45410.1 DNA helicase [Gallibacterium anatis]KGQ50701.1 DNA helicase [Gallibacterium anatis]KGQ58172.1 DNA helicase [Gallibacterium anatis]MBP4133590.1 replicative DNA helicase [Gallibacterium anatis]